jgi:hypothetical protein
LSPEPKGSGFFFKESDQGEDGSLPGEAQLKQPLEILVVQLPEGRLDGFE